MKILIIRLSAIGDTIHTLPLAYSLRNKYPEAQIDWVVEDKAACFILNNPLLNNVYTIKKQKKYSQLFKIIKEIRKEKYDIVIDTQQLFKSSIIMGLSGARRKIMLGKGRELSFIFANEIIKTDKKFFDINYHAVRRNMDIAEYLGCENTEIKIIIPDFSDRVSSEIKDIMINLDKNKKIMVLAPATTWINKHWMNEKWEEVINEFKKTNNIIITASEKEKKITEAIINKFKNANIIDLTGKTTLYDLVYIFSQSDLIISPDSGSAHIAWASGAKNIITLFFATSAGRTGPIGKNYINISAKLQCSPCMKRKCKYAKNKNKCREFIDAKEIINNVKEVLQ